MVKYNIITQVLDSDIIFGFEVEATTPEEAYDFYVKASKKMKDSPLEKMKVIAIFEPHNSFNLFDEVVLQNYEFEYFCHIRGRVFRENYVLEGITKSYAQKEFAYIRTIPNVGTASYKIVRSESNE